MQPLWGLRQKMLRKEKPGLVDQLWGSSVQASVLLLPQWFQGNCSPSLRFPCPLFGGCCFCRL